MHLIIELQNLIKLQGEIEKPITIIGDLNTTFSKIYKTSGQKINKDREEINNTQ